MLSLDVFDLLRSQGLMGMVALLSPTPSTASEQVTGLKCDCFC